MTATRLRMSNSQLIPFVGFGTTEVTTTPDQLEESLNSALDEGCRHIDTSFLSGTEHTVGQVVKRRIEGGLLSRRDLFITTKLPPTAHRVKDVEKCLRESLSRLQTDYVDLFLVYLPCPVKKHGSFEYPQFYSRHSSAEEDSVPLEDTWRGMELVFELGLAKAIGVCNFSLEQLMDLNAHARIRPHNLQLEMHLHLPQNDILMLATSLNITVTAYAPLAELSPLDHITLDDDLLMRLAAKYRRTPAQILLRHQIQRGVVVIVQGTSPQSIQDNLAVFDFTLDEDDLQELNNVEESEDTRVYRFDGSTSSSFLRHTGYPFTEVLDAYLERTIYESHKIARV
uniref:Aldo_ket_red domain-containing protein n=1 Tax=Steinernema glaseri TaxID=37863 RepID=A0A1I7ZVT1_9BILA